MFVKIAEQLAVAVSGGEAKPQKAAALPFPPEASAAAPEIADGEAAPDADTETDQKPAPDANISAIAPDTGQAPPVIGVAPPMRAAAAPADEPSSPRSEEHTSELQSLMRNSYAVFCLKKKK